MKGVRVSDEGETNGDTTVISRCGGGQERYKRSAGARLRAAVATWGGLALVVVLVVWAAAAPAARPVVYVVPIDGVIDLGLAPFVERVLDDAAAAGAQAVVLDVNTFGGRVDGAVLIRDAVLRSRLRTVAFVNPRAISAGALISLAAETIAMAEGGTIGAATPVQMGGPGGAAQPVEEKTVSYMRKEFRATAEARKRPPLVAEAMVDVDVAIPGVVDKGKLLTLTTVEALEQAIADFRADSLEAVLARLDLPGAEIRRPSPNWAERLVRLLTHPVVGSVLMTLGILGIVVEFWTPGFGLSGALGVASLALFFWGQWLVRLAGWEEVLLVGLGVLLLAVELFVLPGFGIAGLLGIGGLVGGLTLSLLGAGATGPLILEATGRVLLPLLVGLVGSLVLLRFLPRLPWGRRLVLETGLGSLAGYTSAPEEDRQWAGKRGTVVSPLHPAGLADLEGQRVDVVSEGEYVEAGAPVEVVRIEGNRIVIRRERGRPGKG